MHRRSFLSHALASAGALLAGLFASRAAAAKDTTSAEVSYTTFSSTNAQPKAPYTLRMGVVGYMGDIFPKDLVVTNYPITGSPEEIMNKAAINVAYICAACELPGAEVGDIRARAEELMGSLRR